MEPISISLPIGRKLMTGLGAIKKQREKSIRISSSVPWMSASCIQHFLRGQVGGSVRNMQREDFKSAPKETKKQKMVCFPMDYKHKVVQQVHSTHLSSVSVSCSPCINALRLGHHEETTFQTKKSTGKAFLDAAVSLQPTSRLKSSLKPSITLQMHHCPELPI